MRVILPQLLGRGGGAFGEDNARYFAEVTCGSVLTEDAIARDNAMLPCVNTVSDEYYCVLSVLNTYSWLLSVL